MRFFLGSWAATLAVSIAIADDKPRDITFGSNDAGKVPAGWTSAKTGDGKGSIWSVEADKTAPSKTGFALAQTAAGPSRLFNLCIINDSSFQDGEISVAIKAVKGQIDQGGGVVWRYKDSNNYYICRYNPLESNLRLYAVKDGQRKQLATKEKLEIADEKWFTLHIRHSGDNIVCSIDGAAHLRSTDSTFAGPGQVGVWTKADAVTYFDQLRFTPHKK